MICKHILLRTFLNEQNSVYYKQLKGSIYCNVLLTIQLDISYLFTHS